MSDPITTTFSTTTPRRFIKVDTTQDVTFEEYTDDTTGTTTFTFKVPLEYNSRGKLTYIANKFDTPFPLANATPEPSNYWVLYRDNCYQLVIPTEYTSTSFTVPLDSIVKIGLEQGTTSEEGVITDKAKEYIIGVPDTYKPKDPYVRKTYVIVTDSAGTTVKPEFLNDDLWQEQPDGSFQLRAAYANIINTLNGSLGIEIIDFYNQDIGKFTIIPGKLDTKKCCNGDYADVCIPIIFNILNNGYIYPDSILNDLRDNLAAFFPSIGLEQNIVDATLLLVNEFVSGKITIEQFNVLLKIEYKRLAANFGNEYFENYVKLQVAIDKYKYLLINLKK